MWYTHTTEYFSAEKQWSIDTCYSMDKSWNLSKWKKVRHKKPHTYSQEISRIGKSTKIKNKSVVQGLEGESE